MENKYQIFQPQVSFSDNKPSDIWFIFKKGNIILKSNEKYDPTVTFFSDLDKIYSSLKKTFSIGILGEKRYLCGELDENFIIPPNFVEITLREAGTCLDPISFSMAGKGFQTIDWDSKSIYCGRCGNKLNNKKNRRGKECPQCKLSNYPTICPAIIVAIIKEGKILLVHNARFKDKRYSLVAGFVDINETLEDCVKREVFEEVNIRVKNIKYIKSESWPFPNSVMLGFLAEHDSGEIKVDGEEVVDAGWYDNSNLPVLPPKFTIARQIIDLFLDNKL